MSFDDAHLSPADQDLLDRAAAARAAAYAPYSRFQVGAALRTADGTVFSGCNIENASFGMTICAERVAVFSAVAAGMREFSALAVVAGPSGGAPTAPCGACRQVLAEFAPTMRVLLAGPDGGPVHITSVDALLPQRFTLDAP